MLRTVCSACRRRREKQGQGKEERVNRKCTIAKQEVKWDAGVGKKGKKGKKEIKTGTTKKTRGRGKIHREEGKLGRHREERKQMERGQTEGEKGGFD